MSGTTSSRFFWADWRSDPDLRACSFAARGLWMDMLAIMAENDGMLLIGGKQPSIPAIARSVSGTVEEVTPLLVELEEHGVFSRDRNKTIYSRRMVKGFKSRKNGKLGGNPKLLNTQETADQDNLPYTLNTEHTAQDSKKDISVDVWPSDYVEQFWRRYPPGRKTGKAAVARKLETIRKSGVVTWGALMAGLQRYVDSNPDPKYTKGPLVWLNQGCWDDELTPRQPNGPTFADIARHGFNLTNEEPPDDYPKH